MLNKQKREHLPVKLQNLALEAKEELEANNSHTRALPSLLQHPYLKRNVNIILRQNQSRLQNNLIHLPEAKLMTAKLVSELLRNYHPEKKANFNTYFSTYFPFKIKKMTRKNKSEKTWENLKYYSENKKKELKQLQIKLEDATKHRREQKVNSLKKQAQFLGSDYDNYRSKQLQNTYYSNPEYQFAIKKKTTCSKKSSHN